MVMTFTPVVASGLSTMGRLWVKATIVGAEASGYAKSRSAGPRLKAQKVEICCADATEFVTPDYLPPRELTDPPVEAGSRTIETSIDSRALGEELGVGDDVEEEPLVVGVKNALHSLSRAHGQGALFYDNFG